MSRNKDIDEVLAGESSVFSDYPSILSKRYQEGRLSRDQACALAR
jgi:hypothetical protein